MTDAADTHRIHRHPWAPWATLRVTRGSSACYLPHTHTEYSIGMVDAGEAVFHHPGGPHRVRHGTVVLIEPGVAHACNPLALAGWSYRMLFIDARWLHGELAGHGLAPDRDGLHFPTRAQRTPEAFECVDQFCAALANPASAPHADWLTQALPAWVAAQARPGAPDDLPPLPPQLAPAWEAIHSEPPCPLSVQTLADACGLHPTTFIRRFKAAVGMTPGEYLRDRRVNGARRLIADGADLAEAAYTMGFADQAHLQRAFRARHAMTPGRFAQRPAQR